MMLHVCENKIFVLVNIILFSLIKKYNIYTMRKSNNIFY